MTIIVTGCSGFIGYNLCKYLEKRKITYLGWDIKPPPIFDIKFLNVDLLSIESIEKAISSIKPECIFHLAANADIGKELTESYYIANISMLKNLISVVKKHDIKVKFVFTSSMLAPMSEKKISKLSLQAMWYARSKFECERLLCYNQHNFHHWVIVRPTTIWGPYHERNANEFLKVVERGIYLHPSGVNNTRTYGFVLNTVDQLWKIANLPIQLSNTKTFYLGDNPIVVAKYVDSFSFYFRRHRAYRAPLLFLRIISLFGDILTSLKIKFPLTSFRLKNIISSNPIPMKNTFDLIGDPPYSLGQSVVITCKWYLESRNKK